MSPFQIPSEGQAYMSTANRDYASITVSDPDRAAQTLCELFGWRVCSAGPKMKGGHSIRVGTEKTWITLCAPVTDDHVPAAKQILASTGTFALNHVGIPARCPETLAAWYGDHFKLMVEGAFAYGDGWLFASATAATFAGQRSSSLPSQCRVVPWRCA